MEKTAIDLWIKTKADAVMDSKNLNILCDREVIEDYQSVFYRIKKEVEYYKLDDADTKLFTDYLDRVWDLTAEYDISKLQDIIKQFELENQAR